MDPSASELGGSQTAAQAVLPPEPSADIDASKTAPQVVIPPETSASAPGVGASIGASGERAGRSIVDEVNAVARRGLVGLRAQIDRPSPPPGAGERSDADAEDNGTGRRSELVVWGLAQPLLGLRVLLRDRALRVRALAPVAVLLVVCAIAARAQQRGDATVSAGVWGYVLSYYTTIAALAPVSAVFFTRNYARLAAEARPLLGLEPRAPYLRSYWQAFVESVVQLILLGVGVAPLVALIEPLPLAGWLWGVLLGAAWALHWIVVEALDNARTLAPDGAPTVVRAATPVGQAPSDDGTRADQTRDEPGSDGEREPGPEHGPPWYSAHYLAKLPFPLSLLTLPLRLWGIVLAWLGRRWRTEVAIVEDHPWIALGFGLGAALLLAIPVLNLFLRPAIVVAASHVHGRLDG